MSAFIEGLDSKGGKKMVRMFETHKLRAQEELSGSLWDFCLIKEDAAEAGRAAEQYAAIALDALGGGSTAAGRAEAYCGADNRGTRQVYVPGCWENLPGLGNYRGRALYTKYFSAAGRIRLVFKGVSHTATVWLDGEKVAEHYNAFTEFATEPCWVETGEHRLEVLVDNRFGEASALHIPNDYMTYGGISRAVVLETFADDAYIEWAHYTPVFADGAWRCEAEICVASAEAEMGSAEGKDAKVVCCGAKPTDGNTQAELRLLWNGQTVSLGSCALRAGGRVVLRGSFAAEGVQAWSPEQSALYMVTAQLCRDGVPVDDLIERIGFREVRVEGNRILLNGKPLRIKGVCRHEDREGFGCALPVEVIQQDLVLVRDLGLNSIRTTHYPNDERFLDLCDEQGILVWEENHARGLVEADMRNPNFERQCEQCNLEMVQAHYNHPCIYIWGILNECASETEYGRACYKAQLDQLRALDQSRPLTFATCRFSHQPDGSQLKVNDICMDLPDVVSYNCYPLWYFDCEVGGFLKALEAEVEGTPGKGKPMIISEIGAGAEYGFRSLDHLKWSEEYQRDALEQQVQAILADETLTGFYIWQFADVRVSREWFSRRPRSHNNKGLVDEYRRPKLAYETVRSLARREGNYLID